MKYLHKFESESAFTEYYNSEDYFEPWVSYTKDDETEQVDYNKYDPSNGHCYVDLGLPSGTKWACMNIGAENPEDLGNTYYWGETEPYDGESSYKFGNYPYTKYNSTDQKEILDLEDDVANAEWGGEWHIPTLEQVYELLDYTTREESGTTDNGNFSRYIIYTSNINGNKLIFRNSEKGILSWINATSESADYESAWVFSAGCEGFYGARLNSDTGYREYYQRNVRGVLGDGPDPEELEEP